MCLFRLDLRGYSVALLPRASRSQSRSLCSLVLQASHSHSRLLRSLLPRASRFALTSSVALLPRASHSYMFCALRSRKFLKKISVSQLTQNALKRIEMPKKILPLDSKRAMREARIAKRKLTYPMSLPVSQGVSMPSFMPIGPKLWALEGYRQTVLLLLYRLALPVTSCLFRLALRGYLFASLPQASRSYSRSIRSLGLRASHSHSQSFCSLGLCARTCFALRAHENFRKKNKCVSIDLKCSETHRNAKKSFTPLTL